MTAKIIKYNVTSSKIRGIHAYEMADGSIRYKFMDGKRYNNMKLFKEAYEKHFKTELKLEKVS